MAERFNAFQFLSHKSRDASLNHDWTFLNQVRNSNQQGFRKRLNWFNKVQHIKDLMIREISSTQ